LGAWAADRAASAQEREIGSLPQAATQARTGDEQADRTPQRRLDMSEVEILGEVDKPRTMFILPRSPHQYILEGDRKDFTENILSPMNKRTMQGLQQWRKESAPP